MTVQGTLGSLLQGVSQQPAQIRLPGQVSDQVNMYSDVSTGLSSRAGHDDVAELVNAEADLKYYNLDLRGQNYIVGYKPGTLRIWDTSGVVQDVVHDDLSYIGLDMRFHVFDDVVYCANRTVEVLTNNTPDGYPFHIGIVTALGGNFTKEYKVEVTFSDGSTSTVSYTTPDGDAAGDAAKTTSTYIIDQLGQELLASTLPADVSVSTVGDVLLIKAPGTIALRLEDGDAGTILRQTTDVVDDITHLPQYAPHGALTKVIGDAAEEDDYYLRFNVSTTDIEGEGFGDPGTWEEWYNVEQPGSFIASTMPHALHKTPTGFSFEPGDWEQRRTGDDNSNPMPSIVGNTIRDIGGFESRLVVVAGPNVVLSRTGKPLDFFKKSATVVVDDDPIDMKSTKEGSVTLDWIVPFDRNLILLSDPGDSQFVVTGGGITPSNASLVLTTSYEMFGQARPVTTGRTLIFPFRSGGYSGIKEFFTNDSVSTNGADTLTEVQNRYIVGDVTNMASSKNFNLLLLTTADEASAGTVWTYKYLWDGQERIQSSWSTWEFRHTVKFMFFDNSTVYIILDRGDSRVLTKLDMNRPVDSVTGYHVCLDHKQVDTLQNNTIFSPYADAVFIQYTGCPNPGSEVLPAYNLQVPGGYNFYFPTLPDGAQVLQGIRFTRSVTPTMPRIKDRNGSTISSAAIVITKFNVYVQDTGDLGIVRSSPYREPYEFRPYLFPLDDDPIDPERTSLYTGVIEIPWGERADYSEITIQSSSVHPTSLLEVEWQGQVTGTRRRI